MGMTEQDKIGRGEVVGEICLLVNNLIKGEHFCVALDGAWGSGKSFVLEMIAENLCKHDEYIIIKYDAWENSFYGDPLISILSCIIDDMQEKLSAIEGYSSAIKEAGKELLKKVADSKMSVLTGIVESMSKIICRFNNPFSKDTSKSAVADFKSYKALLAEVKQNLYKILEVYTTTERQSKLIILVDELDRCLPDEQLKILERLHHLFDMQNSAVIVAVNLESVAKNVNTMFGVDGGEYLRKFFDFRFKLKMSSDDYLNALLNGMNESLATIKGNCEFALAISSAYQCLKYGDKKVLDKLDNREIFRYFDALMRACGDFGWEHLNENYLFFLIVALYIKRNISLSFLSESEIIENQKDLDFHYGHIMGTQYNGNEMPYFDYLDKYIGVDRLNISDILKRAHMYSGSPLAEYSWSSNEIVCYSYGKNFVNNGMRTMLQQPKVIISDCQRLRQIVMLYGGGEK